MSSFILDSSALLALFNQEAGAEVVQGLISSSVMSTVNIAEVVSELDRSLKIPTKDSSDIIYNTINKIIPLSFEQAVEIGNLRKYTREYGLSLGDRACIALGIQTGYTIYTADKIWAKLNLNCQIILIR